MKIKNYGAVDYVKDYRVAYDEATFKYRITNLRNGLINGNLFKTKKDALAYAKRLAAWHKVNKSEAGLKRTAEQHVVIIKNYHLNKQKKEVK